MEYYTAKRRLSPRASNTTVQKGDCRHTRAWTITMQKTVFFSTTHLKKTATHREGTVQRERSKKEKHLTAASLPCETRSKQAKVSIVPYRRASLSVPSTEQPRPIRIASSATNFYRKIVQATVHQMLQTTLQALLGRYERVALSSLEREFAATFVE